MSLIITSGYGLGQLIPTAGYGTSLSGTSFFADSVELPQDNTVRVRYTRPPRLTGPLASTATFIGNYTLTHSDGSVAVINQASAVFFDDEVVDLHLSEDLKVGLWTLVVSSTVESADTFPYALQPPYSFVFELSKSSSLSVAEGATNDSCADTVRKYLNPAYRYKPTWEAVLEGVATGDCISRDIAQNSFDQAFISSASGKYLTSRASESSIYKPEKTGMSDDIFRQLAISVVNDKLTQISFLKLLSVFYGQESVSAYTETLNYEPFVMFDGSAIDLSFDEGPEVRVVFQRKDFDILRRATAEEVAFVISKRLGDLGVKATAVAVTDPETGVRKVRIYSDMAGLGSSVRIVSGTAMPALGFSGDRFPGFLPSLPNWTIQKQINGNTRIGCSTDLFFNLSTVQEGDFIVIIGDEFSMENRGSFRVLAVNYSVDLTTQTLNQWVEVSNPGSIDEVVAQLEQISVKIYEAVRNTTFNNKSRVVVTQQDGKSVVSIPSTSKAVSRKLLNAAYCQSNTSIEVSSATREPDGELVLTTLTPHGLSVGDQIIVDDLLPDVPSLPIAVPGNPTSDITAFGRIDEGTSDKVVANLWSKDASVEIALSKVVRDSQGRIWSIGGQTQNGTSILDVNRVYCHQVLGVTVDPDGSRQHDYRWTSSGHAFVPGTGAAAMDLSTTEYPDSILIACGYTEQFWKPNSATGGYRTSVKFTISPLNQKVLIEEQLDSAGILGAVVYYILNNPLIGDFLSVTDGVTTRTYGFGVGGDVTVTIGASITDTLTNLESDINGDGSAVWGAKFSTGLTDINNPALVIFEDAATDQKSPLRIFGTFTTPADHKVVEYATDTGTDYDYTGGTTIDVPSADPGAGRAGFHRAFNILNEGEIHQIIAPSFHVIMQWDEGFLVWLPALDFFVLSAIGGAALTTPRADASIANFVLSGGSTRLNEALSDVSVYDSSTDSWSDLTPLVSPRLQHNSIDLGTDTDVKLSEVLVTGGRQPITDIRAPLGVAPGETWTFEGYGATATGPVDLAGLTNPRPAGKVGHGLLLDAPAVSAGGATQTATNADLLGDYTITGWMSSISGVVAVNRGDVPWVDTTDNMLFSFGIDDVTDEFFVKWQSGAGVLQTVSFGVTRAELMPFDHIDQTPRYYHFAVNKVSSGGTTTWTLFVEGVQVGQGVGPDPTGGSGGLWKFGAADEGVVAFTGAIDEISLTSVMSASDILALYLSEIGVAYDSPIDLDIMPVGKVLNTCEILDGTTGFLRQTGKMTFSRFAHNSVKLPDGRILVAGGIGYDNSYQTYPVLDPQRALELRSVEIWNPSTGRWSRLPDMNDPHSYGFLEYIPSTGKVYVGGGLNSKRTEALDLKTMQWSVTSFSFDKIRAHSWGGLSGDDVLVMVGGGVITGNQEETDLTDHQSSIGPSVAVSGGGLNGQFAIKATTSNTVTINTPHHKYATVSSTASKITAARAEVGDIPGPFSFNTKSGFSITDIESVTTSKIKKTKVYTSIELASTSGFSDSGFVVLNFGRTPIGPIEFIAKAGNTLLLRSFTSKIDLDAGATVTELSGHGPYIPENPEVLGSFYLTASPAGRIAAQKFLKSISASGIELDVDIRYPGDRGLGGEGFPGRAYYKLSDKVWIFGGDEPDQEIEVARGS